MTMSPRNTLHCSLAFSRRMPNISWFIIHLWRRTSVFYPCHYPANQLPPELGYIICTAQSSMLSLPSLWDGTYCTSFPNNCIKLSIYDQMCPQWYISIFRSFDWHLGQTVMALWINCMRAAQHLEILVYHWWPSANSDVVELVYI